MDIIKRVMNALIP